MRWHLVGASRQFERDLRQDLFQRFLLQPPSYFARASTGDLVSRMTADVEAVRMTVGPGSMYVANTITVLPVALFLMAREDPTLTAWVLAPMVALAAVFARLGPAMERASTATQEAIGKVSGEAAESFTGIRVLKLFTRERAQLARMDEFGRDYLEAQLQMARVRGKTVGLLQIAKDLGLLVILGVGALHVVSGDLSVGGFFLFNGLLVRCFWPLVALGWMVSMLHRGAAAMRRIGEVLDAEPVLATPARPVEVPKSTDLEWQDVTVRFGDLLALDRVSLRVPAGKTLGITGRTGAGKSVLASLVPRLLDVDEGSVRIGGVDVREWPLDRLRATVAMVPQDAFLFSETLRENVRFAAPQGEEEALQRALHTAALDQDLAQLPDALDTLVGERGVTLSGGQRQRATLARSVLEDAPVLILDDTLSAVDAATEHEILRRLRTALRGRTALVISHRVAALRNLDSIVVLDGGRVVEQGTHAELLGRRGHYYELERRQRLEQELEEL